MASQPPDVEILVHVTAPSRVADDASYRQLARAYLAFQPEPGLGPDARVRIARARLPVPHGGHGPKTGSTSMALRSLATDAYSSWQNLVTPDTEQPFGTESQELSFQSAIDNRSSPRLRPARPSIYQRNVSSAADPMSQPLTPSQPSWKTLPSEIDDSYPLPGAGIINVTPTRVLQRYLQQQAPSTTPSSSRDHGEKRSPTASFEAIDVPSSIPVPNSEDLSSQRQRKRKPKDTIPVTPVPPGDLRKRHARADQYDEHAELGIDVTHISSSFASVNSCTPTARVDSEPPQTKISKRVDDSDHHQQQPNHVQLARTTSDAGPVRSSDPSMIEAIANTLDIRPSSPPVSVDNLDPASLVSSKLDKLARDLSSRYNPLIVRQVEPFERGYWLVDCTSWPDAVRLNTWVFLTNYLHSGLAGWGVWCRRDRLHDWIRFYCWGYVAKHTYLLLYLASGRQIKLTGAQWHDAAGDAVLTIAGTEKR